MVGELIGDSSGVHRLQSDGSPQENLKGPELLQSCALPGTGVRQGSPYRDNLPAIPLGTGQSLSRKDRSGVIFT